jgi:hypothetical protein
MDPTEATAKRSAARLRRLAPMLEVALDDAAAALELLVGEAEAGDLRPDLWEKLHAAAARDDKLVELGSAYEQLARGRRLRTVAPEMRAALLMHGADFLLGILGDADGSAVFLQQVVAAVPEHAEAFARLERYLTAAHKDRDLAELYANVAGSRQEPPVLLIGRTLALIERLSADQQLSLEACERLVRAAPINPRVGKVIEAHLKLGGRFTEAATLMELAAASGKLSEKDQFDLRGRLVALYMGPAKAPDSAIGHIEELLRIDSAHVEARKAAEKLLAHPKVASRAAAALHEARKRVPQEH